ncbi:hypothetical protein CDCA_CDCA20G4801 [Cyanidium caldarium]|uniref:Nucleotide-diphospho-sugar transferase domain-containing protein n=1 Tax=Cyanidium caldarium TaxID=2771 RepID=A0AAV9J319_CYACA|nr:hypothetical protein CDCA_CDCA20G4801 [Cyanidium caldarium]
MLEWTPAPPVVVARKRWWGDGAGRAGKRRWPGRWRRLPCAPGLLLLLLLVVGVASWLAAGGGRLLGWSRVNRARSISTVDPAAYRWDPVVPAITPFLPPPPPFIPSHSASAHNAGIHSTPAPTLPLPQLIIYTAPKPTRDRHEARAQMRALQSWTRLQPPPFIVLFGNGNDADDAQLESIVHTLGDRVIVDRQVDSNFQGVPLFHSMFLRALQGEPISALQMRGLHNRSHTVSLLVNADIVLPTDLPAVLATVRPLFADFLAIGARWDVDESHAHRITTSTDRDEQSERVRQHGTLHSYGGIDWFAWRYGQHARQYLFNTTMPPFVFGRGKYDNWLLHEVLAAGRLRGVIDLSEAVAAMHAQHAYAHVVPAGGAWPHTGRGNFWSTHKRHAWESYLNVHLALAYGSYRSQMGTPLHAPYKLVPCLVHGYCVVERRRPAACRCEYSSFVRASQTDPQLHDQRWWHCGQVSTEQPGDYPIQLHGHLAHTLDALLPAVADATTRTVVMTAASYDYRYLLMNWVCNLRRVGVRNVLVAAMDDNLYRFAYARGLAVFYNESMAAGGAPSAEAVGVNTSACAYGTACFRQRVKLKSRHVLQVLRRGYHVLWSDVDVVWFRDARRLLAGQQTDPDIADLAGRRRPPSSTSTLYVQSNEPAAHLPANGVRRANSGFYWVPSSTATVAAFERIVAQAARSPLTEQPSFYDVLCGATGEHRLGDSHCLDAVLHTRFLDREQYPHGAHWHRVLQRLHDRGADDIVVLHNNWVSGLSAKIQRLQAAGLWFYRADEERCTYHAHHWIP